VIVVPFFISDGLHSYEDIPVMLGIAGAATRPLGGGRKSASPHQVHGRSLFYSTAIGTDPKFAEIIMEQAQGFEDRKVGLQSAS
jgi:sirohydrochlorin cobaltochelatase